MSFGEDDFEVLDEQREWRGFFEVVNVSLRHRLFGGGWSGAKAEAPCRRCTRRCRRSTLPSSRSYSTRWNERARGNLRKRVV